MANNKFSLTKWIEVTSDLRKLESLIFFELLFAYKSNDDQLPKSIVKHLFSKYLLKDEPIGPLKFVLDRYFTEEGRCYYLKDYREVLSTTHKK